MSVEPHGEARARLLQEGHCDALPLAAQSALVAHVLGVVAGILLIGGLTVGVVTVLRLLS
ncbi:hypothetical protein LMG28140_00615 [Paraburkholderia metrosideri]|jgi:hypothetical protein|uniref:Uncharacterized protein n=1 Tax=Paraburkholderia metrosideri TaxID=580937 RepID=A0ABN7HFF6_9BURK|nr:hypothetical protein LMG28140_00615 [Paraburkholderia metrosideri]